MRWQLLPPEIKNVCVGPDGRTWYTVDKGPWKPSDAELRDELAREYRQRAPQIKAASLALLEPSGRIWFLIRPDEVWGYDGQTWIERKTTTGSTFDGECPTRGEVVSNRANRAVGGRVWLPDNQGLHIFDGQDWTYTTLGQLANAESQAPHFAVSPNGNFAVAMTPKSPGPQRSLTNPNVWIWEASQLQWTNREMFWGEEQNSVGGFCVTDEGKLWCRQNGTLRILDLRAIESVTPRLAELIAQLDDDDAEKRQQAYETLSTVAEQIQPQLSSAQKIATSPEQKRRLDALLERISVKRHPMLIVGRGTPLGSFTVHAVGALHQDDHDRMIFAATISTPYLPRMQNTIVTVDRGGNVQRQGASFMAGISALVQPKIFHGNGNLLWISGSASANSAALRLDMAADNVISQSSDMNYPNVLAVDAAGRTVLRGNYFHLERSAPLGVFSPEFPDPRPSLQGESSPVSTAEHLIATDGKLWAVLKNGLSRFDGNSWELIHPASRGQAIPVLAGREGVVLCRGNLVSQYLLFEDNQLLAVAPLRRLIAAYPEKFAAAFPPTYTPRQTNYQVWIAADARGNIWMLEQNRVAAYDGEDWIEGPSSPRLMRGSPVGLGSNVMSTVGAGSRVFFSTALAAIDEGKMVLSPAPACHLPPQMPVGVRDRDGAFWLPAYLRSEPANNSNRREHYTIRLGDEKPLQEFKDQAWPFLLDESGNVWLAKMGQNYPPSPRCHFWVWRDGRIVQEIEIPLAQHMRGIYSDKPGSVYVWTSLGLHHLASEGDAGSGPFALKQTYALPTLDLRGNSISMTYSPLAGLVIPTHFKNLTIIPLPTE